MQGGMTWHDVVPAYRLAQVTHYCLRASNAKMDDSASTESSIGTRVRTWFESVAFATRAVFVVCVSLYITELLFGWSPTLQVCLRPKAVVEQYKIHRLLTHAFFHLSVVHVAFNMLAFVPIGGRLERQMGTVKFVCLIFAILMLSDVLYILLMYLLATANAAVFSVNTCAVGFSGVIFGLIVVHANSGNVDHYSVLGLFPVPAKLYAWVLLVFWQLLIPGVSFIGHLCGVLVGQMYVWRALASVMPSDATVVMIERSVCCAFTQWPNFILSANTSVSLPIHASHTEGSTSGWSDFFTRWRNRQEQVPFTGEGSTTGTRDVTNQRFPGQPQFITDPSSSASHTASIAVIEAPQDDFARLVEMGFDESSVRAALLASDGDFTTAMNKLTGAT